MYNIEKHLDVYTPFLTILIKMVDKSPQFFKDNSQCATFLIDILFKISEKLGHEHSDDNLFSFMECLLKIYIRVKID